MCLPCTGGFAGGIWRREKHPEFGGKHPEFGVGPKFGEFWGVLRRFWVIFWGGFGRFGDFRGERMEQVVVAWFVSGLFSCGFAVPGLFCPCDQGKSDVKVM